MPPYTSLGWQVTDITQAVRELSERGVVFEQYGLPGQAKNGISTSPSGAQIAWFKDPEGHVLSLAQDA
jgi:hypothetical protein